MKITIIVGGKFHAFQLAKYLNNYKYLNQIITSYPKYSLKNFVPEAKVISLLFKEIIKKGIDFLCPKILYSKFNYYNDDFFDYVASKKINYNQSEIIIGWSGFSKRSFQKASKKKCIKILERGSAHIVYQYEILKNEYCKLGIKPILPSKEIINKELEEYKLADFICVPSNFAKKTFIEEGVSENKLKVIPLGVDLDDFAQVKKLKKNNNFIILSTGEVSVRKGSHLLIDVFNDLSIENSKLIFAGSIERGLKSYLNKIKKNSNIIFLGSVSEKKLKKLYNESSIFVLNSLEDGFGMVIPQAMACGLPVITTSTTGASEIIENNKEGFVIPPNNKDSLKEKIKILFNNNNLMDDMSKNSIKKVSEYYTWSSYGNKIIEFYQKIYKEFYEKN
tara:strand:- start:3391 stop:4563 length:1173 start_codon:yes stop_codon:yes gene_type:complete